MPDLPAAEGNLARMTERQRIRIRSTIQKCILILAAAVLLAGIGLLIGKGIRLAAGRHPDPDPEPEPVSAAILPEEASPTPEPTPAPTVEPYADRPDIDPDDWNLRLVNSTHPLEEDFAPELTPIESDQQFDARAGMHLRKLMADARDAGFEIVIKSGYRSYDTQYFIFWNHVQEYEAEGMSREEAEAATRIAVNYPGCSEHQLGLAADLLEYPEQDMEPYIGGEGLMLWLEEHCADYGFIIRYPEGKTDITGVEYEPWHLRFVGTCARYITDSGLCLEEFLALYD